jgi:hypothetical protein
VDKALQFRFDYEGISHAGQETITALAERTRAWKFEAVIDAAQHADLINTVVKFHQTILTAKDNITVGGFFHHVSHAVRRSVLRDMLDGIPGIHQQVALCANMLKMRKHAQTLRKRFCVCALYAQTCAYMRIHAQTCANIHPCLRR